MAIKDDIIFWFNVPPKVEKGAFNYLTEHWPATVYYVILNDLADYRKRNHWDDHDFGNAVVIKLWEEEDVDSCITTICASHPSAIHIINGFTNTIQKKVRAALKGSPARIGVYTERPAYYGNVFERLTRRIGLFIKYYAIRLRDEKTTDFVLPLGEKGTKAFASLGWKKEKLFPFMYNPIIIPPSPIDQKRNGPIRFVYVGRFYYKTKGIDILMKACDLLSGLWTLDLVGGYGKDKNKVIDWSTSHNNISFIGNWKSEDVVTNLQDYDVVIVPSKFDGWNLLVNESISAGVGCISSDEAVSHELILASGAGKVYHWSRPNELARLMQDVINKPELVQQWRSNALSYRDRIGSEAVGNYLISILNSVYYRSDYTPKCPWI